MTSLQIIEFSGTLFIVYDFNFISFAAYFIAQRLVSPD